MKQGTKRRIERKKNIAMIVAVGIVVLLLVCTVAILARIDDLGTIDDSYFVSDKSKIVLTLDKEEASMEDSKYEPETTHVVYYCNGNDIVNVRVFFEYDNEEQAKEAFPNLNVDEKAWAVDKKLNKNYVVFNVEKSEYEGLEADKIRNMI